MKAKSLYLGFLLIATLQLAFLTEAFSQVSINDIKGTKIRNTEGYEGIEGSPYFSDKWVSGEVMFVSGKNAKVDYLKYDMVEDRVFFSDKSLVLEYNFAESISAFRLSGAVFQNNFPAVGNFNKENYYEVISKGKYSLLKKEEVVISERVQYGTPSARYFKKMVKCYVYNGEKMVLMKPDAKSLAEILGVKRDDIEKYAKSNSYDLKDDYGLKAVFENFSK